MCCSTPRSRGSGWRQKQYVVAGRIQRRQSFASEIEAAREAFAADPSQRNWAYLDALKKRAIAGDEDLDTAGNDNGRLTS